MCPNHNSENKILKKKKAGEKKKIRSVIALQRNFRKRVQHVSTPQPSAL